MGNEKAKGSSSPPLTLYENKQHTIAGSNPSHPARKTV